MGISDIASTLVIITRASRIGDITVTIHTAAIGMPVIIGILDQEEHGSLITEACTTIDILDITDIKALIAISRFGITVFDTDGDPMPDSLAEQCFNGWTRITTERLRRTRC